ncbi:MAG TPA: hypothetical protein VLA43_00805, partial [Longimicrobiales bacterium]|nr:hypothetical protein [Longimicrobiales bacterium]
MSLNCLLLGPAWIFHGRLGPQLFALEAGIILGIFLLLPRRRWSSILAGATATGVVTMGVLGVADTTARLSLARPLNLYLDVHLAGAVANLLDGALGSGWGPVALAGIGVGAVAAAWGLARLLMGVRHAGGGRRAWQAGAALVAASALAIPLRWAHPRGVILALPSVQLVREQAAQLQRMLGERERFALEMARTPAEYGPRPGLFRGLGGRDVILAFIESYGVSALDDPRYGPVVRPRLEAMEAVLARRGIHLATGRLDAPSQGGMSWLGHGSVLSGLWLENQMRYDLLMASDRPTLVDDFRAAGYRTAAIMPAITLAWPEGERLGYDEIWDHKDIPYRGPPLNWVTMPDQFTWSFLEHGVRIRDDGRPLFAELGHISSHAPWTPILDVVEEWERIGDGALFGAWENAGATPEELWRDTDRVREHYALAVGYALDVLASYAARYLDGSTLLIAMGDHQPAPLITGEDARRAVPVHVLATD